MNYHIINVTLKYYSYIYLAKPVFFIHMFERYEEVHRFGLKGEDFKIQIIKKGN